MVAPKPGCTASTWATGKTLQRNAALPCPPVYLSEFALAFHYRGCSAFSPLGLRSPFWTWEAPFSTFSLSLYNADWLCVVAAVEVFSSSRPGATRGLCMPGTYCVSHTLTHTRLLNRGRKFCGIKDSSISNGDRKWDSHERHTFSKTAKSLQRLFSVCNLHSLL